MDVCEVCGVRKAVTTVVLEGAEMHVCHVCAKYGKKVRKPQRQRVEKAKVLKERVEDIVDNFGDIIKKARQALGLKRSELARQINEKEGYLEMIEEERTVPSLKTARKLEKALNVKLIKVEDVVYENRSVRRRTLVLRWQTWLSLKKVNEWV